MSKQAPHCRVCTTSLRTDGTCPFKCDPTLANWASRRKKAEATVPVEKHEFVGFSSDEQAQISRKLAEKDPAFREQSERSRKAAQRRDAKRKR